MKVLIAGGGIGGLTTALCCLHFGHDVTVFEQAAELSEVGAGIQIPPNAMNVFEALGIEDAIAKNAFRPTSIEARMGETGRFIFTIPLADQALKKWGAPYLHIHRADYLEVLCAELQRRTPHALQLNASVKSYRQTGSGVSLVLNDGREFAGDVLIGADGIKSIVRNQMLGPDKPRFTGNVAWRVVVPIENLSDSGPNPTACVWMGRGRHGVTYLLRRGELVNFVGVVERDDWQQEGWAEQGQQEEALEDFKNWHPIITNIIKSASPDAFFRWALFDRTPLKTWADGNVALLGDAAHPMLPFLAQGAAMAVEDAWCVAREMSERGRLVTQSLNTYQQKRYDRTRKAQLASRKNMKTFHQRTKIGKVATYGPMWLAGKLVPQIVHQRMDWLYGYDVTKEP